MRGARRISKLVGLSWLLIAGSAHADRVHLVDGAVIDGDARREGGKVVILLDAGEITLDADAVKRIDEGPSVLDRLQALEAVEKQRGVTGWLVLADFCRDEGLRARELAWLEKVIEREPQHAEARARLGYVKDGERWIKAEEQARARKLVEDQAQLAEHARQKAALELEAQRVALERERLKLEHERQQQEASAKPPAAAPYAVYGSYWHHGHGHHEHCQHADCRRARPAYRGSTFPIAGVRDPRDPSWRIPGVKDPLAKEPRRRR
jgi:hypothetical protein